MSVDVQSRRFPKRSIAPAVYGGSGDESVAGDGVNVGGFAGTMVVFNVGTITDGVHTPELQESDDNSVWNTVAAEDMIGTLEALASDTVQKVGYRNTKRYVRAYVEVTGTPSTGGIYGAVVDQAKPGLVGGSQTVGATL